MTAKFAPLKINDRAVTFGFGPDFTDDAGIIAVGYEADILTVRLGCNAKAKLSRDLADISLWHPPKREAQIIKLILRRCEQEIALIARGIERAVQFSTTRTNDSADIMASGEAIGTQFARESEQISEFYPHIAAHTGDWRAPAQIFVGKMINH